MPLVQFSMPLLAPPLPSCPLAPPLLLAPVPALPLAPVPPLPLAALPPLLLAPPATPLLLALPATALLPLTPPERPLVLEPPAWLPAPPFSEISSPSTSLRPHATAAVKSQTVAMARYFAPAMVRRPPLLGSRKTMVSRLYAQPRGWSIDIVSVNSRWA